MSGLERLFWRRHRKPAPAPAPPPEEAESYEAMKRRLGYARPLPKDLPVPTEADLKAMHEAARRYIGYR